MNPSQITIQKWWALGLLVVGWISVSCSRVVAPSAPASGPTEVAAPGASAAQQPESTGPSPVAAEPTSDPKAWLETGLPALIDAGQPAPFELLAVRFSINQVDQQLLEADYRRSPRGSGSRRIDKPLTALYFDPEPPSN